MSLSRAAGANLAGLSSSLSEASTRGVDIASKGWFGGAAAAFAGEHSTAQTATIYSMAFVGWIVGVAVLAGWWLDLSTLKAVVPGFIAMQPWTAVGLLLGSSALMLAAFDAPVTRAASAVPAVLLAISAGIPLVNYTTDYTFATDLWLFPHAVVFSQTHAYTNLGRMSLGAAFGLTALACALLLAPRVKGRIGKAVFSVLGTAALAPGVMALLSYALRLEPLEVILSRNPLALHSAVVLIALAIGVLALRADAGWIRIAAQQGRIGWVTAILVGVTALLLAFGTDAAVREGKIAASASEAPHRLEMLLSTLRDAESSQRGYLLTDHQGYLEPYEAARRRLPGDLAAVATSFVASTGSQVGLDRLNSLVAAKMAELAETVALRRGGHAAEATALVESDRGSLAMGAIRSQVASLAQVVSADAEARAKRAHRTATTAAMAVMGVALLGFVAVAATTQGRKQVAADLAASEARLRLVQQVGGVAYSDRLIAEASMLISKEFAHIHGLQPGQTQLSVEDWLNLLHPDDRDRLLAESQIALQGGGTLTSEFRIRRPDGSERWISMRGEVFLGPDGQPLRLISAWQDTTDIVAARNALANRQQELEQRVEARTAALAEAEARFRGIFDSQFQFIGLLAPDGMTLEMNRTALDASGLTRDQVVGRRFWQTGWWPAEEGESIRREITRAAQGSMTRREVEINGADGKPIQIDFSLKPIRDPATGAVASILAEGRDLSEKRDLASQLAQAQKVQALGQLAGGIAHDFNNILQAVAGAATLIGQRPGDQDRTRRLSNTLIAAANRGTAITQRLLSFARRGDLRAEVVATGDLLINMREVLAHTLGTTITVCTEFPPNVPSLIADQPQLETAIINLGTNARDAMSNGGKLILSAEADHVAEGDHHPAGLAPGDYIRLGVADNGTGMDAATLVRVSEPFFTTKPHGQGTGLGVAMVKGFAEQSGGGLSIASTPGNGTTVNLWLRQAVCEAAQASDNQQDEQIHVETSARILLVDDDELVRETLAASLEAAGLSTLVASSGSEALALLEAGEVVDAMVSDLSMPDMNGVTTIQKARALCPQLPCFLLTGYVGERAALSAQNTFTLVRKPVTGRVLIEQIEASLESART